MSAKDRDRTLYIVTLAALCAVALVPIWRSRLLPLLDLPNHLAAIQIWNKLGDPEWHFQDYYDYSRVPVPYWGYYLPVHLLSYVTNIEIANKLYLSAYAVSLPLSVLCLARAFDRSPVAALFTIPFVFNDSWAWGFLSYVPGVPVLFFGLASLVALFRKPSFAHGALFFALLMTTFFMHVLAWAALCVFVAVYTLGQVAKRRALFVTWALLIVSLILCAADTIYCSKTARAVGKHIKFHAGFEGPRDSAKRFLGRLISYWPNGRGDSIALAVVLIALAVLVVSQQRKAQRDWHDRFVPLSVVLAVVLYVAAPLKLSEPVWIYHVNTRYAVLVPLFATLLLRGPIDGARRVVIALAVAASLYYPVALSSHYAAFNVRARAIFPLMERIPIGSSTLTLLYGKSDDRSLDPEYVPWNEFQSYPAVFRGGFNAYGWHLGFPFVVNQTLPAPTWGKVFSFSQELHGRFFDYVLTRNEPGDGWAFGMNSGVKLIAKSGEFRLYQTRDIPE